MYWHSILSQSLKLYLHNPHFVIIPKPTLMEISCASNAAAALLPGYVKRLLNWLQYLSQLAQNLLIWVFPSGPTRINALTEIFPLLPVDFGLKSEHHVAINCIQMIQTLCKLLFYFVLDLNKQVSVWYIKSLLFFGKLGRGSVIVLEMFLSFWGAFPLDVLTFFYLDIIHRMCHHLQMCWEYDLPILEIKWVENLLA